MNKKVTDKTFLVLGMIIVIMLISLIDNLGYLARQPYHDKIDEYQLTIKPEMIISILPSEGYGYSGKPIVDWKLDELAFAMATAQGRAPNHPLSYGLLYITLDTRGTGIEPNIRFALGNENFDGDFIVYFTLQIMRDGELYASGTFMGEGLNEWARSVGIADKENW